MTTAVRLMAMISGPRLLEQGKLRFVSTFNLKKVIGFDELADKLFTPLYQFHFQESEAYTLYNKALGLQRQDIQKAEEAFEQLLSHGFIREVFYCCNSQTGSIPTPDNSVGRAPH